MNTELREQRFLRTLYENRKPVFPARKVLKYIEESIRNVESPDDVASSAYTINSDLSRSISTANSANETGLFKDDNEDDNLDNETDILKSSPKLPSDKKNILEKSPSDETIINNSMQNARSDELSKTVDLMEQKISLFDKIVESAKSKSKSDSLKKSDKPEKLELPFGAGGKQTFKNLKEKIEELKKKLKKKLELSPSPQKNQEPFDNSKYTKIVQVTFDNKTLIPTNVEIFDKEAYLKTYPNNAKDLVSMKTFIAYQLQNNTKGLTTDDTTTMSFYYNGDETEASKLNFENPIL